LPLSGTLGNYLQGSNYSGFAYVLQDSMSTGCGTGGTPCGTSVGILASGEFCGCGTTGQKVKVDAGTGTVYPTYGAGVGANLSQASDGGVSGGVTVSAAGLTYAVSSVPPGELEIEIKSAVGGVTTEYCTVTTAASGTVPWASFFEKCTSNPPGPAFAGTSITGVVFQARAEASGPAPYDFCVTALTL
jgi:hypothetical protein